MEHLITENDDPELSLPDNAPYEPTPVLNALIAAGVALIAWGIVWWGAVTAYRILGALHGVAND